MPKVPPSSAQFNAPYRQKSMRKTAAKHVAKIMNFQVFLERLNHASTVRVVDFEGFAKWVYDQESHQTCVKNDIKFLPTFVKQCKISARKNDAKIMENM